MFAQTLVGLRNECKLVSLVAGSHSSVWSIVQCIKAWNSLYNDRSFQTGPALHPDLFNCTTRIIAVSDCLHPTVSVLLRHRHRIETFTSLLVLFREKCHKDGEEGNTE